MPAPATHAQIKVGDITITYLPDGYTLLNPIPFLPASTPEAWQLHKQWLNDAGQLVASIGGLLIRTGNRTVLVDTGFGDRHVDFPGFGPFQGGELLNSCHGAGRANGAGLAARPSAENPTAGQVTRARREDHSPGGAGTPAVRH